MIFYNASDKNWWRKGILDNDDICSFHTYLLQTAKKHYNANHYGKCDIFDAAIMISAMGLQDILIGLSFCGNGSDRHHVGAVQKNLQIWKITCFELLCNGSFIFVLHWYDILEIGLYLTIYKYNAIIDFLGRLDISKLQCPSVDYTYYLIYDSTGKYKFHSVPLKISAKCYHVGAIFS